MRLIVFFLIVCCACSTSAQQKYTQLSPDAEISLLTIGSGKLLNDAFGHNAVRVKDDINAIDAVFNYGRFNFNTPNFYLKFAQGKLPYSLGVDPYEEFEFGYKLQQRWIKSQELNLSKEQKQEIFEFLANNAKEENKYYKYDFFYDNCSTRPFYIIKNGIKGLEMDYAHQEPNFSHRDLIHQYISWNTWGSLGIDVALGSVIDRPASPEEYLFLPHELMNAFAKAKIKTPAGSKPLAKETETIFSPVETYQYKTMFFMSPLFIFSVLGIFIAFKTYNDYKASKAIDWLDATILAITGIIGVLLGFLWLGTDHTATAWNYNLLWAFPFHILAALVIRKRNPPQWIHPYMKLSTILLALLFFHWMVGVQAFAWALLPLLIAIGIRYWFILKRLKKIRLSEHV